MLIIALVGMQQGEPLKLIYGKDFNGNVCGKGDNANKTLLYYPRINDDMLYAMENNIALTSIEFYGFCVETCPKADDSVCGYSDEDCLTVPLDTENVFFRCLPVTDSNSTVIETVCTDPVGADPDCSIDKYLIGDCSIICKIVREKSEVWTTTESSPNPLLDQLQGVASTLGRLTGDIENTGPIVLVIGGIGAVVLGVFWLLFLQYFASIMVWLTCFLVVITMFILSLYCSVKAEIISADSFGLSDFIPDDVTAELEAAQSENRTQFQIASYFLWALTFIILALILAMKKRIKIAIAIIREASRCLRMMPLLILWPVIPAIAVMLLGLYWMTIAAYILSADEISFSDVAATVNDAASSAGASANVTSALGAIPGTNGQDVLFMFHLFGFLWTNQLVQAISICTIAGAVSQFYWSLPDQFGNRDVGKFPIAGSFKRTVRFHLGSLCFGSFIIAVVQLMRIVLEYIDHNTRDLQDSNALIRVMMKAVKCCLWCFEKCLKFLSKNAYIIIAMKGSSFCSSARQAFMLILSNIARVATVNSVSFFLLLLAKITITSAAGALMFSITSTNEIYKAGGEKEVSSPFAPVLVRHYIKKSSKSC